jgi:hypothetical protein
MANDKGHPHAGQSYELVGRPRTGKPKKEKNIKVTYKVHCELSNMGCVSMDMGDVVEMLLNFWKEKHSEEK